MRTKEIRQETVVWQLCMEFRSFPYFAHKASNFYTLNFIDSLQLHRLTSISYTHFLN